MRNIILFVLLTMELFSSSNCRENTARGKELIQKFKINSAFLLLEKSCDENNCSEACNLLAISYSHQIKYGDKKNSNNPYLYFIKACNGGMAISCCNAAKINEDQKMREQLYKKALSYKDPASYRAISKYYIQIGKSHEAIKLLNMACDKNIKKTCIDLAKMYHDGIHVFKNSIMSKYYVEKAGYRDYREILYILH